MYDLNCFDTLHLVYKYSGTTGDTTLRKEIYLRFKLFLALSFRLRSYRRHSPCRVLRAVP